jgi:protoporphyrinogen IX oxidase
MDSLYLWFKAAHVVAIIAWLAALLYLPRLMVYHCAAEAGSVQSETFKVMERRLLMAIANPAMLAAWVFGLTIAVQGGWFQSGWMHAKLLLVILLSGYTGYLSKQVKVFAADRNQKSARFFRILNEVPTVLMIAIVVLVIVKPF